MNFLHCKDIVGAKYSHMPLSLPTIAALTPKECTIEIIDSRTGRSGFMVASMPSCSPYLRVGCAPPVKIR